MMANTYRLDGYTLGVAASQSRFVLLLALLSAWAMGLFLTGCQRSGFSDGSDQTALLGPQNIATQHFVVDADKGGVVQGTSGFIVAIPAGAFTDSMGNAIHGPVDFYIKEARRDVDILVGGLVTRTGDQLLASDGMYMIDARMQGQPLRLNPSVGVYASFPTDEKNPDMRLYAGAFDADKVDWKLMDQKEKEVPYCDRDKASREKCKRCERLAKMSKKIKPGKKPKEDDYWAKRYVWENGKMYFYSSGSKQPVFTQEQLDDCADYLAGSENGKALMALVEERKAAWRDQIGNYYNYQLQGLGWFNIDRLVKEELVTFKGRIIDQDGQPKAGAEVHLYCKDNDLRIHTSTRAVDGSFELQFEPGRNVTLFAFGKGGLGKTRVLLRDGGQTVDDIVLTPIDPSASTHTGFLDELM